jgi:hypothetical protein
VSAASASHRHRTSSGGGQRRAIWPAQRQPVQPGPPVAQRLQRPLHRHPQIIAGSATADSQSRSASGGTIRAPDRRHRPGPSASRPPRGQRQHRRPKRADRPAARLSSASTATTSAAPAIAASTTGTPMRRSLRARARRSGMGPRRKLPCPFRNRIVPGRMTKLKHSPATTRPREQMSGQANLAGNRDPGASRIASAALKGGTHGRTSQNPACRRRRRPARGAVEQLVMTEDFDVFEAGTGAEGMEKVKAGRCMIWSSWTWACPTPTGANCAAGCASRA